MSGRRTVAMMASALLAAGVLLPMSQAEAGESSLLYASLFGVAAVSPTNAWAVGQYQAGTVLRTLIVHWDGKTWQRVASPDPAAGGDVLSGVAVVSAGQAWAVGGRNGQPLILRWNGFTWKVAPSPVLAQGGALAAVTAISATDAWAVGLGGSGSPQTVIEHWNGKSWQVIPSPVRTGELDAVSASSASDVWAAGFDGNWSTGHVLAEHWNGTSWRAVSSPDPAGAGLWYGIAATSASNAWTVTGAPGQAIGTNHTEIDHWNGRTWARVTSPNPVPGGAILMGTGASSATNAWAVGTDTDFAGSWETTIAHWNGAAWQLVHSPIADGSLYGVTALSVSNAWAVGSGDSGALIMHWNGTRWTGISFS